MAILTVLISVWEITAVGYLQRDLKISKELDDTSGEERTYVNFGIAYGNLLSAMDYHERNVKILRKWVTDPEKGDRMAT